MVVPPFGFGVGDFLAVAKLAGKIASELKDNGDATSKYQDLIIELESLERALSRLYTLKPSEHELVHLEAIRAAASACKRPLESFMETIEKFEKRLGTGKEKDNRIKGAGRRIQFNVAFEEDVKELRSTLASHVSIINTLLMTQMLDSMTIAETDRAGNIGNLRILFDAQAPLLHDIIGKQHEVSTDIASCKDSLDALQEKIDLSQTPGAAGSAIVDEQKEILDAIKSEIGLVRDELADRDTNVRESTHIEPANSSSFASALAITSTLASLMLSGTMIASAHTLTTQARDMSTIARRFEVHSLPMKVAIDQLSASTKRPSKEAKNFVNSSGQVIADDVDSERPTLHLDSGSGKSDAYKTSLTAVYHSQKGRANQPCETKNQSKVTNDLCETDSKQNQVLAEDFLHPCYLTRSLQRFRKDDRFKDAWIEEYREDLPMCQKYKIGDMVLMKAYNTSGRLFSRRHRIASTRWSTPNQEWEYKLKDSDGSYIGWFPERWLA